MPKPTCVQCESNDSLLWRNAENGQICNECYLANTVKEFKTEPGDNDDKDEDSKNGKNEGETTPAKATGKGTRKSTRATRYKVKTPAPASGASSGRPAGTRGRGRRSMFKRPPLKAPTATPTVVTSESLFYKGHYIQVGDIVSMIDLDGGTYYAQIRGLLTDQYCEKSAVITWLLPTTASPPPEQGFDPATYIIGPEEDLPRKLEVMEFVMHAPSDYYKAMNTPYPLADHEINDHTGFVWTTLEKDYKEKT